MHDTYFTKLKDFIEFIEENNEKDLSSFLEKLRQSLVSIYFVGFSLPKNLVRSNDDYPNYINPNQLRDIINHLKELLKDSRYYWEVFNPIDDLDNKIAVCGDLIDDIEDIYCDIKNSLLLYQYYTTEAKNSALWLLDFQFKSHWGDHCINAIRACHYLLKK